MLQKCAACLLHFHSTAESVGKMVYGACDGQHGSGSLLETTYYFYFIYFMGIGEGL